MNGAHAHREAKLLGYRLHPLTKADVLDLIADHVERGQRLVMANLNLHGMAAMFESPAMSSLLSSPDARVMIDGMPMIWLGKLLGLGLSRDQRMTSLDYFDEMFRRGTEKGWRFDYLGSTPEVMNAGLAILRDRFPGLDIEGRDGYFATIGGGEEAVLDWLRKRSSDVLIVGMGMPRQEAWLERVRDGLPTRVLIPVGAYLEYQTGSLALAPRWMGQLGVEWLYRLVTTPRRLAYRYLVEPFVLAGRLLARPHPQEAYWRKKDGKAA